MPNKDDIRWFKQNFHAKIEAAIQGTPFTADMLTAVACQETGYIWSVLRKNAQLSLPRILELCVGDTLDGRSVFPKDKAALVAHPNGQQMFDIAHQALVDMAVFIPGYKGVAKQAHKFCHGFGVFQYDIQFFEDDPDFFLQRRYVDFDHALRKALLELQNAKEAIGWKDKTTLTDMEMAFVAIVYNMGTKKFKFSNGLKQGHEDGGKYYGENIFEFMRLSKQVPVDGIPPVISTPAPGNATVAPPTPVSATGPFFEVDVKTNPLRLRSEPKIDENNPTANVIARLPDGHIVQAIDNSEVDGFREVETSLNGAHLRGFASAQFLKPAAPSVNEVTVVVPAAAPPVTGIVSVIAPRPPGTLTKRTEEANALSLNENGQPGRKGTTPDELRAELAAIIKWLAVDNPAHKRYAPQQHPVRTFCNIYAHDYCHLAGVYLPRVWWSDSAIAKLAQGKTVEPKLDNTIFECRANYVFRWLRDNGPSFGWRQTGSLTTLQTEVNQGAIGLIIALRKDEESSGHVAMVVPETGDHRAKRNAAGEVIAPLQSQAGMNNFQYGTGGLNWWKHVKFADSAYWLHS